MDTIMRTLIIITLSILFALNTALIIVPHAILNWDCDDIALYYYRIADGLGLDPVINFTKYNGVGHVWVSVAGVDFNSQGFQSSEERSLEKLIEYVRAD